MSLKENDEWREAMREKNPRASVKRIDKAMGEDRKPHVLKAVARKMTGKRYLALMAKESKKYNAPKSKMARWKEGSKRHEEYKEKNRDLTNKGNL